MKNLLWGFVPFSTMWGIFILHELSGLTDFMDFWYGFPLLLTYIAIFGISLHFSMVKILCEEDSV